MAQDSHSGTRSSGAKAWDALRSAIGTETVEEASARASAPARMRAPGSLAGATALMYAQAPDIAESPDIPTSFGSDEPAAAQGHQQVGQRVRTFTSVSTGFVPLIREVSNAPKNPTLSSLVRGSSDSQAQKSQQETAQFSDKDSSDTLAEETESDANRQKESMAESEEAGEEPQPTRVVVESGSKVTTASLAPQKSPKYRTETTRTTVTENAWEEDAAQEAAAERPRLLKLRSALITAAVPLVTLMLAIRAVASAPFLWLEYRRPGFPADTYGFDLAERMRLGSYGLDYVTNLAPQDYLAHVTTGELNTPAFLASEVQHMHDVKRVLFFATVAVAVFCVLALLGSISLKERAPGVVRRSLYRGAWATVALIVIFAVVGATSWEWLFTTFHTTFFPQGNWQFRASDTLIRLYPPQFWIDAALTIVVLTLVMIGILLALTWPTRYRLLKEKRYYQERYQIRQKIQRMRAAEESFEDFDERL